MPHWTVFIGPKQIQKSPHLETFFVHFELLTKSNHVNLYYFECVIRLHEL